MLLQFTKTTMATQPFYRILNVKEWKQFNDKMDLYFLQKARFLASLLASISDQSDYNTSNTWAAKWVIYLKDAHSSLAPFMFD